jgi:6-phosphogluconolactonase
MDQIRCFIFDPVAGTMATNATLITSVPVGSGPRHMTFDPQFQHAYVINQDSSTVIGFNYDSINGILTPFQTNSTLPPGGFSGNLAAEIVMHPSGKFLYGSNRGYNDIVVYQVNPADGTFANVQQAATGTTPRNFAIDPTGAYCLVADQGSGDIRLYSIDQQTGFLTYLNKSTAVVAPACILPFLQVPPQPVLTVNAASTDTFALNIDNTLNLLTYQLYESTNLSPGMTWNLVTNGVPGQTNFVLGHLLDQEFFKIGVLTNY